MVKLDMKLELEKVSTAMKCIALLPSRTTMDPVFALFAPTTTLRPSYLISLSSPTRETWDSNGLFASAA